MSFHLSDLFKCITDVGANRNGNIALDNLHNALVLIINLQLLYFMQ